jgi:hypothetical protein
MYKHNILNENYNTVLPFTIIKKNVYIKIYLDLLLRSENRVGHVFIKFNLFDFTLNPFGKQVKYDRILIRPRDWNDNLFFSSKELEI